MTKELIISKDLTPAIFFEKDKHGILEVTSIVASLQVKVDAFDEDVKTKKGQAAIRTFAAKIASSKTAIDTLGKDAVDDWSKKVKAVNAIRKTTKEAVQIMQDKVRKPLTDFENAEKSRVAAHSDGINQIREAGEYHQLNWQDISIEDMEAQLIETKALDDGTWEEFNDSAEKHIKETSEKIEAAIAKKKIYDKDQADLHALRDAAAKQEQADRDAKIAEEAVEEFKAKEVVIETTPHKIISQLADEMIFSQEKERYKVQENMQKFGGSFEKALGVALTRADSNNTMRIKNAFPEYWDEYLNFGDAIKTIKEVE